MSLGEKVAILGVMGSSLFVGLFYLAKGGQKTEQLTKEQVIKKRQEILSDPNIRMLYSTMSFLYLQGFHDENLSSFHQLYEVLQIARPKIVSVQLSQKNYDENYVKIISHPKFPEIMENVEYLLKTKSEELKNLKEVDLKHLEKLYLINYCKKNKCKIVCQDIDADDINRLFEAKLKVKQLQNEKVDSEQIKKEIKEKLQDEFVDKLMQELTPKFKLFPDSPYKTIVGVIDPQFLEGVSYQWKSKFKSTYGHQILEDESVMENGQS